ncbi:hypothetical protein OAF45_00530 [Candidatus Latescibacteria bacterium]|jgi:hypothetical protein|nr:hypothetical protein [Candidatus Latescibacterota bacterium]
MKKEYDFSQGERGKFYRPDTEMNIPVYLDAENLSFVEKIAEKKKKNISTVVNELIRSDKQLADLID